MTVPDCFVINETPVWSLASSICEYIRVNKVLGIDRTGARALNLAKDPREPTEDLNRWNSGLCSVNLNRWYLEVCARHDVLARLVV